MSCLRTRLLAVAAAFTVSVNGQQSGWRENQVNATMCAWRGLRAATLQDTVYMDGGFLYWQPGMADGSVGALTEDGNPLGIVYTLNFSRSFDANMNMSEILSELPKVASGNGATNIAPNYYDGAMLANDYEFFLYGGLLRRTDAYTPPDADEVSGYRREEYGPEKPLFFPGFFDDALPEDMTRYVSYGGAASAPSEEKGWYFGGMRAPSWGPVFYPTANASTSPTNVSNTLVTLDMTEQLQEAWTNVTLPDHIQGRANPELVWVPVGEQGILVVLGGVTYPEYNNQFRNSSNQAQSELDSPGFMSTIDIYDVASENWYQQETVDSPPQLAMGCAVVASAQDFSSYNIYYYGGYDGIGVSGEYNDDVWVLSLPSFTWTMIAGGSANHARIGHKCVKPYPDQMMVIGGEAMPQGAAPGCLEGGLIQMFNLTEGRWMNSYDPNNWSNFGVPTAVQEVIGGDYTGGATASTPSPSGWTDDELAGIFTTRYDSSRLRTYYPYTPESINNSTREDVGTGGGALPTWVAPVLGVVLGLVFITAIAVAILLFRRRKYLKKPGTSESGTTDETAGRIRAWIRGQSAPVQASDKAMTVTSTEDTPSMPSDFDSRTTTVTPFGQQNTARTEMAGTPLFELPDNSLAVELSSPDVTEASHHHQHSNFPSHTEVVQTPYEMSSPANPSSFVVGSEYRGLSHDRRIDSPRDGGPGSVEDEEATPVATTANKAALANSGDAGGASSAERQRTSPQRNAVVSGVSTLTERDHGHLRNMSDATVSSTSAAPGGGSPQLRPLSPPTSITIPLMGPDRPLSPEMPVSPPTAEERYGMDYLTLHDPAHGSNNGAGGSGGEPARRRSVFHESKDDLGDRR